MADLMKSLALAASGMQAQAGRLRHVSENIANADTPGYHRKTVSFEELAGAKADEAGALVTLGAVQLDRTALARIYDPSHPMADESG